MRVPVRLLVAAILLLAFLLSDVGEAPALPLAEASGAQVTSDDGMKVARRRSRRPRPRPSPRPRPRRPVVPRYAGPPASSSTPS